MKHSNYSKSDYLKLKKFWLFILCSNKVDQGKRNSLSIYTMQQWIILIEYYRKFQVSFGELFRNEMSHTWLGDNWYNFINILSIINIKKRCLFIGEDWCIVKIEIITYESNFYDSSNWGIKEILYQRKINNYFYKKLKINVFVNIMCISQIHWVIYILKDWLKQMNLI